MGACFCRARVSVKEGVLAGVDGVQCVGCGDPYRRALFRGLQCWCFGLCFALERIVASRGAEAALTKVFPKSGEQAENTA